jgi:hypothetical protein
MLALLLLHSASNYIPCGVAGLRGAAVKDIFSSTAFWASYGWPVIPKAEMSAQFELCIGFSHFEVPTGAAVLGR